jgi:hypothetical protein
MAPSKPALRSALQCLLELEFDHSYMCRGLIIDKRRGNMLKADRHKYVKLAFHGFASLSREARMAQYNNAGGRTGGWMGGWLLRGMAGWREVGHSSIRSSPAQPACLPACPSHLSSPCHTLFLVSCAADKREEFDEPSFALIDTLFSLAEAHLFMQASTVHSLSKIHSTLMALRV